MKIKMKIDKASVDRVYKAGEVYEVSDNIGNSFIKKGQAEKANRQQSKAEDRSIK